MAAERETRASSQRSRPLSNATYLTAANVGAKVFSFIFVVYANHTLGSGLMGAYYEVLGFIGLFGIVTDLGLGQLAVRDVAQDRTLADRYVANLLAIRLSLAAVAIVLAILLAQMIVAAPLRGAVYIYAFSLLPMAATNTLLLVFQFSERLVYNAVINILTSCVSAALGILLIWSGHGVLALIVSLTAVMTVSAVGQFFLVYTRFLPRQLKLDLRWWPRLMRSGVPFAALVVTNILYSYADRQILYILKGCKEGLECAPVGNYAAAYRPLDVLVAVFIGSINAAVLPVFARVGGESPAALRRLVRTSATLALVVGIPIAVFGTFYSTEAMYIVGGGPSFVVAAPAMSILIWTFPCILLLTLLYNALYALHKQKVVTMTFAATLVFNVALNVALIPHYSYMASAALTVASEVLNGTVVLVVLRRSLGPLDLTPSIAKMGATTAAMVLTLWWLHRFSIVISAPVGVVVMLLGLRVTRVLEPAKEALGRLPFFGRYARWL